MFDIHKLMDEMAVMQPVFHSRRDFHAAVVLAILKAEPSCCVKPDFSHLQGDRTRLNIWIPKYSTAIRLRYPTSNFQFERRGERYSLLHQGATDRGRYEFLRDVGRLERVVQDTNNVCSGIAVMLTNDHLYWNEGARPDTVDADFRIHDGAIRSGRLAWSEDASEGTKSNMEQALLLQGSYEMQWHDYSNMGLQRNAQFRYLAVEVGK